MFRCSSTPVLFFLRSSRTSGASFETKHAFFRYGILDYIRRLSYSPVEVEIDTTREGDRLRIFGVFQGNRHKLCEFIAEKQQIEEQEMLYIHWLNLQNPRAQFSNKRPQLPGQEAPGLGLAKEASALITQLAERLRFAGVAFQPAWFHIAYAMRRKFTFLDPNSQGLFEALVRDLSSQMSLLKLTNAISDGHVLCNGETYTWKSGVMVSWAKRPKSTTKQLLKKERIITLLCWGKMK